MIATVEIIELLLQGKCDETENRLVRAQVLQLLKLCLRTYFTFDGTIYEQVKGTPMGLPISRFIAEAVLQRLESLVFQHHRPKFLACYVNPTLVVIDLDQLLTFKEHLNAVFPDIQFTMDEEENNQLAFMDVLKEAAVVTAVEYTMIQHTHPDGVVCLFTDTEVTKDNQLGRLRYGRRESVDVLIEFVFCLVKADIWRVVGTDDGGDDFGSSKRLMRWSLAPCDRQDGRSTMSFRVEKETSASRCSAFGRPLCKTVWPTPTSLS
nr:unnamed protein product [Spirometra erinaceieuropaei]